MKAEQQIRRHGSIKKIAQRWHITEAEAAEIADNVESAQTTQTKAAPDMAGLDLAADRRPFVCRRDTMDLVSELPTDRGTPAVCEEGRQGGGEAAPTLTLKPRRSDVFVGSGVQATAPEEYGVPPDPASLQGTVLWSVDCALERIDRPLPVAHHATGGGDFPPAGLVLGRNGLPTRFAQPTFRPTALPSVRPAEDTRTTYL